MIDNSLKKFSIVKNCYGELGLICFMSDSVCNGFKIDLDYKMTNEIINFNNSTVLFNLQYDNIYGDYENEPDFKKVNVYLSFYLKLKNMFDLSCYKETNTNEFMQYLLCNDFNFNFFSQQKIEEILHLCYD